MGLSKREHHQLCPLFETGRRQLKSMDIGCLGRGDLVEKVRLPADGPRGMVLRTFTWEVRLGNCLGLRHDEVAGPEEPCKGRPDLHLCVDVQIDCRNEFLTQVRNRGESLPDNVSKLK